MPFELFARADDSPPAGGGAPSDAGDDGDAGDEADDGAPSEVYFDCRPTSDITERVLIQNVLAKRCLTRGPAIQIEDSSAFGLTLEPCDGRAEEIFLPIAGDVGDHELRHQESDFNLDVLLASSDDGATLQLFEAHALYNQRFFLRSLSTPGQMQIAPRHIPNKCLSLRGDHLEIWPCDPDAADQVFEMPRCSLQP